MVMKIRHTFLHEYLNLLEGQREMASKKFAVVPKSVVIASSFDAQQGEKEMLLTV